MGDVLGYARVSTGDQDVAGPTMRLEQIGAIRVFTDVRSGKSMDRPGLQELVAYARKGDTLAVVRLDRLGRSLAELLAIAHFERRLIAERTKDGIAAARAWSAATMGGWLWISRIRAGVLTASKSPATTAIGSASPSPWTAAIARPWHGSLRRAGSAAPTSAI
jgi:hypothetical protein